MTKFFSLAVLSVLLLRCNSPKQSENNTETTPPPSKEASFKSVNISSNANLWWARCAVDVDGDGILDVALHDSNGSGGWLGYLKGNVEGKPWETVIVAEMSPSGKKFAAGDLDAGDIDGDGDTDLIGVEHPGEWTDADADAVLYWYEQTNSGWKDHKVGTIPSALKDISLADLNNDGSPEIVTVTYNAQTLSVFSKSKDDMDFQKVWDLEIKNLHEGMDVGDINGDGHIDIAANGYWLPNPGSLDGPWELKVIDERWFNQEEEHWARNATKHVCKDVDNDGKAEVFISHSEKTSYPVAKYDMEANGTWSTEILLDSIPAAHSLVVTDIDLDGEYEVLTGINKNRAINIQEELGLSTEISEFPVYIIKKKEGQWTPKAISTKGVYNLLAGDLEGDGDVDLVRLTTHDGNDMDIMINGVK